MTSVRLIHCSATSIPIEDESVQTCVTSPPYWGLRQYAGEQREVWGGAADCAHEWGAEGERKSSGGLNSTTIGNGSGQSTSVGSLFVASTGAWCACGAWYGALGLEPTPELYVAHMVDVFREVRRVLRRDGTLWLNLGDSYAGGTQTGRNDAGRPQKDRGWAEYDIPRQKAKRELTNGLKPKDLVGIPWMVAFALRADGWYLRSDIIWHKPNPMPESVTDRPTKAHEYLFLLTKSERYFYDADAIREANTGTVGNARSFRGGGAYTSGQSFDNSTLVERDSHGNDGEMAGRNKRTVWTIATRPYPGAHFATYPEQLVEPCILAGTSPKACGVCGAPWERVTERELVPTQKTNNVPLDHPRGPLGDQGANRLADGHKRGRYEVETTGWRSTCEHEDDSGFSTVLDPFNGSGTTGRVAVKHGRSYVGVDISQEYLDEQAVKRVYDVQMEAAL